MMPDSPTCRACGQPLDGHKGVQALCEQVQYLTTQADVYRESRDTAESRAKEAVQSEMAALRAENARLNVVTAEQAKRLGTLSQRLAAYESRWHDPPQVGDVRWVRQVFAGGMKPTVYPDDDDE